MFLNLTVDFHSLIKFFILYHQGFPCDKIEVFCFAQVCSTWLWFSLIYGMFKKKKGKIHKRLQKVSANGFWEVFNQSRYIYLIAIVADAFN